MPFVVGAEDESEHQDQSKDVEALVDYKQFYAKSPADSTDIESHRTGEQTVLIGVNVPKHRNRRRRRHRDGQSGESDDADSEVGRNSVQSRPLDSNQPVPADRLRELLMGDEGESHALFCELEELQDGEWHERARWVRFEEDVEEGGGRWSKPFVATLPLHALFELRQSLSVGVVMLDVEPRSYQELVGLVVDAMIGHNQLEANLREDVIGTLLAKHIHQHEHAQGGIKRGLSEIGKKFSSRRMDEVAMHHHHPSPSPSTTTGPSQNTLQVLQEDTPGLVATQLAGGLGASAALVGGIAGLGGLTVPSAPSLAHLPSREENQTTHKPNEHFAKKLAPGTEASSTLVGAVEYLNHAVTAFVRLSNSNLVLDDLTEVAVPTRFVYVMLGPAVRAKDFHEIGRAMATVMSDDIFRDVAYRARDRADLLAGLDEFLDEVTILPPGEWDPTIRIQPPKSVPTQEERKAQALNQIAEEGDGTGMERVASSGKIQGGLVMTAGRTSVPGDMQAAEGGGHSSPGASTGALADLVIRKQQEMDEEGEGGGHELDPTLQRTGRIFGGLIADIKRKAPWYWSDIKDAMSIQCVAAVFFMFFACLSPIVTFGGLLGKATDNHMAAFESILTAAVCGTTYHLFSGQPLTIIGSTGPVLVFEKILFTFSKENHLNYLTLRFWIGIWTAAFMMLLVAFDLSALVQLITRFTEESFAALISTIFIFEAFLALYEIYQKNPLPASYAKKNTTCWCDFKSANDMVQNYTDSLISSGMITVSPSEEPATSSLASFDCPSANNTICDTLPGCAKFGPGCSLLEPVPDVFFFSCLIFLGTYGLSTALKAFRFTPFFPNRLREVVSDFAVLIAILLMVLIDALVGLDTPKLRVPKDFSPTRPGRPWVVDPFDCPIWVIFGGILPAILLSILLFMDQQITAVIVNRREHKLVKGNGYHLDLFVLTLQIVFCATLGLPYFVAATVLAINHVTSLRQQSETSAPGEVPKFLGINEQRMTGFLIFALIGCSIPLKSVLEFIPMPVLYGVFLYMGVSALKTSQFFDRILLVFMPVKYQPDSPYLRHMKTWRVHLFTGIQLLSFTFLWVIKQIKEISIAFPLMLVIMVIIRKLLDYVFTQDELRWVDDCLPKNPMAVRDPNEAEKPAHVRASSNTHMPACSASAAAFSRQVSRPAPGNAPLQDKVNISSEMSRTNIWHRLTKNSSAARQSPDRDATSKSELEPLNNQHLAAPSIAVQPPSRDVSAADLKGVPPPIIAAAPAPTIVYQQTPAPVVMYPQQYPHALPSQAPYYPPTQHGYAPPPPPAGIPPSGPFYPQAAYPPPPNQPYSSNYPPPQQPGYPPPQQPGYPPQPAPQQGYPNQQPPASQPPPIGFIPPPPLPQGYNQQPGYPSSAPPPQGASYPGASNAPYPGSVPPPAPYPGSSNAPYPGSAPPPAPYPGGATSAYSNQPGYNPNAPPYGNPTASNTIYPAPASAVPTGLPQQNTLYPPVGSPSVEIYAPSIRPVANFNAQQDCEVLRKAMKGIGTDEAALISVLCRRSWQQRNEIERTFKQMFGKDLEKEIKSETSGNFYRVLQRLLKTPHELAAFELREAVRGLGTDEDCLVEIICTSNNADMMAIRQKYFELYRTQLERDIAGDTSGHFKRLLVALLTANRPENQPVDWAAAAADARALYAAGEGRLGTDESRFNAVLCSRSYAQLRAIFECYKRDYKRDIEAAIRAEFSGDIADGLLAVVAAIRNKQAYFASRLHYSMAGAGTHDTMLIRIITSRCDIDLTAIKQEYQKMFGRSLVEAVKSDTSGDYRKALVALLGD